MRPSARSAEAYTSVALHSQNNAVTVFPLHRNVWANLRWRADINLVFALSYRVLSAEFRGVDSAGSQSEGLLLNIAIR